MLFLRAYGFHSTLGNSGRIECASSLTHEPILIPALCPRQTCPSEEGKGHKVQTILLVDDEPDVRCVLRMQLERGGYRVLESETGTHALEIVQKCNPDLIVLDWRLPGLTGIEVLRRIRGNPFTADLIVFMITGMDEIEVRQELENLDVFAVIEKPFDPGSVFRQIDDALGGSSS